MGGIMSCMDDDEYVILDYPNGKEIRYGPGITSYAFATARKEKFPRIDNDQYLEVKLLSPNPKTGSLVDIISGPALYKPTDPYAVIKGKGNKVKLNFDEYIIVKNIDGTMKTLEGPLLYTPKPYDQWSEPQKKLKLTVTQYVTITSGVDGNRKVLVGPLLYPLQPLEKASQICDMVVLNGTDYIYVTHTDTGIVDIVEGPTKFTPGPYDTFSAIKQKTILKNNEYVKIIDRSSGVIRVVTGPATITLKQFEELLTNVTKAHEINDLEALYIFDTSTGSYELITNHGMFVPNPVQNIIEVRKKIRLEQNEVMVMIDKTGKYIIMRGNDETSAFFVPPYCEIMKQEWSNDPSKHKEMPKISKFDTRPQYMDYEFLIRTKDNVEIFLKLNFYWQILDVKKMLANTHNCPFDICTHAKSEILSVTSRVDMDKFMESFNEVIHSAIEGDDGFYDVRGVKLIRVEITGRKCKDPETEKNYQEIIKAKMDRLKNLEQQQGHNEVNLAEIQGNIEKEKLMGELVNVKNTYVRRESAQTGESKGTEIANFFGNLPGELSPDDKMKIYLDFKNTERVNNLLTIQGINLHVTPQDLDIKYINVVKQESNKQHKQKTDVPVSIDL